MASEIVGNAPSQSPSKTTPDYESLVEQFIDPLVIFNKQGKPCFMNSAARQLLAGSLAARLTAHLHNESSRRAVIQVRFPLDDGGMIVLKISRAHIEWQGQAAVLVALHNVTPYINALQESQSSKDSLSRQLAADCENLEERLHEAITAGKNAEKECEQLGQNLRESDQAGEALKSGIADLRTQLEQRTAELNSAMERMRQENGAQQKLKEETESLRIEIANAKAAAREAIEHFDDLEQQFKNQLAKTRNLNEQVQLERNHREVAEHKNYELVRELAQLTQTFEQLQADHARLEEAATAHAAEIAELKEEYAEQLAKATEEGEREEVMPSEENIIAAAMRKAWAVRGQAASETDARGVRVSE